MRESNSSSRRSNDLDLFQRLDRFVRNRNILFKSFWNTNRMCLNLDEFTELTEMIGFSLNHSDINLAKEQFPEELITLKGLQSRIPFWENQTFNITEFVQQKAQEIIREASRPIRSTQSVPKHRNKPCASLHNETSDFDATARTLFNQKQRLKEHRDKMRRSDLILQKTIIKTQNEGDFQLVRKIVEINEICSKLKNNLTFSVAKEEGKGPVITMHTSGVKHEIITQKKFLKQYILLKQQSINCATYEKQTSSTDLKKTLIQTMFLSQQLQQQMQLIRSRGITSDISLR